MGRVQPQQTLRESVLDRLLDDDPDPRVTRDPPTWGATAFERVLAGVRRDLEALLNTRLTWVDDDLRQAPETSRSIATFGLPDFSHENATDQQAVERLVRAIQHAVAVFEPRLTQVVVTPQPSERHRRSLHFRIDAVLRVDPVRAPVAFDTFVDAGRTQVVQG